MLLLELDDSSHSIAHRVQRDSFVDAVSSALELSLLDIDVRDLSTDEELLLKVYFLKLKTRTGRVYRIVKEAIALLNISISLGLSEPLSVKVLPLC